MPWRLTVMYQLETGPGRTACVSRVRSVERETRGSYKASPPATYGQEAWVRGWLKSSTWQQKIQCGIPRGKSVGTSDQTSIMSALPLAGVTVIEVRGEDVVRSLMYRI